MVAKKRPAKLTPRQHRTALSKAMQSDSDFAWTWHCCVATAFQDEGGDHQQSNMAAARFMKQAFEVDVTLCDQWKSFPWADPAFKHPANVGHDMRFAVLMERLEKMCESISGSVDVSRDTTRNLSSLIQAKQPAPFGIDPRPVWLEKRRADLCAAIGRCSSGKMAAPMVWLTELFELEAEIAKESK